MMPNVIIPAYVVSPIGVRHFLSSDPIDDHVIEEMLDHGAYMFFPEIPAFVQNELNRGGWILDIGAYNGSWGVEYLKQFPVSNAIFLEPCPRRCVNINKTIKRNRFGHRTRLVPSGLAEKNARAWLVMSEHGSWGDWLEYTEPTQLINTLEVSTVTLEKALNGIEPIVVKCNAEGGEFEFIRQVLVSNLRPKIMILMVHTWMGNVDHLWTSLCKAGYNIEIIRESPRLPVWHAKWK